MSNFTHEERLFRLERTVRRQRWIMLIIVMIGFGAVLIAQRAAPGVLSHVRTKKLLVYNDKNQIVFMIGSDKTSGKGVWQLIHENKPIATCFPGKWGGSIHLSKEGEAKTGLLLCGDRSNYGSAIVWEHDKSIKWDAP